MKTFEYIVIHKNNMKQVKHFSNFSDMEDYLFGLTGDFLIIVREYIVLPYSHKKYSLCNDLQYSLEKGYGLSLTL